MMKSTIIRSRDRIISKFKNQMAILNKKYIFVYFSLFTMIINFILSGVTVYQSYAGPNSITTFVIFLCLFL